MSTHYTPALMLMSINLVIAGIRKRFPLGTESLTINGVVRFISDLLALLLGYQQKYAAVESSRQAYATAVSDCKEVRLPARELLKRLRQALMNHFGANSQALKDFGFNPEKAPEKPTTPKLAQRAQKARLTRQARHTMGKRQKKEIKGGPIPDGGPNPSKPANQ